MITIEHFNTSFRLKCNRHGYILNDDLQPTKYNIRYFIERFLTIKEEPSTPYQSVKIDRYVYYDRKSQYIYIPKCYYKYILSSINYYQLQYQDIYIPTIEPIIIDINMKPDFKDKPNQTPVIDFVVKNDNPMVLLELQTGFGKTYCSIKSITKIQYKSFIITPGHLQEQWVNEILKFTNIEENKICIIKGKPSWLKLQPHLANNEGIKHQHDIYISTIQSLYSYISEANSIYDECLPLDELFQYLGIGIKIIDEVHMNFKQILCVDMLSNNIRKNIYLSATFVRTNKKSNMIFQSYFNDQYKYQGLQYKKYVNITECEYSLGYIPERSVKSHKGYSEIKYEKYLVKHKTKFRYFVKNILIPLLEEYYLDIKNEHEKCLILIDLKMFGYKLMEELSKYINNVNIGVYFNEHTLEERDQLDIIISTIRSSGVGSDIKKLRSVILFSSFQAESWIKQCLGRLRELETTPEFIYLVNSDIKSHRYHAFKRRCIISKLSKNFKKKYLR